jgi:hypothetical protein
MAIFGREFHIERLSDAVLEENIWLCDMLRRWHPSGDAIDTRTEDEGGEHLRLAIRNGYLNFYRAGQSVAKVDFGDGGRLRAKIHKKYVYGDECGEQGYVKLNSNGFPELGTGRIIPYDVTLLRKWIARANRHTGAEKRFVDLVVGRNCNVIDLEVGLPAYSKIPEERRAPRMDLVRIESDDDRWRVVFWEAKSVTNVEARCQGANDPRVIGQLKKYTDWFGHPNHLELVAKAYQSTCRILVDLHAAAKGFRSDIEELGPGIRAVAAPRALLPLIDDKPRLLIDDREGNIAFTKNAHLKKLQDTGLHVQMVTGLDQMTLGTLH